MWTLDGIQYILTTSRQQHTEFYTTTCNWVLVNTSLDHHFQNWHNWFYNQRHRLECNFEPTFRRTMITSWWSSEVTLVVAIYGGVGRLCRWYLELAWHRTLEAASPWQGCEKLSRRVGLLRLEENTKGQVSSVRRILRHRVQLFAGTLQVGKSPRSFNNCVVKWCGVLWIVTCDEVCLDICL